MSRFLRFCAFLSVLFLATNVFAAGYTCPTAKRYTSCATNYYVSDCGTTFNGRTLTTDDLTAGNSCIECPDGYTCSGGLVCPRISQVTIAYVTGNTTLGQSQPFAGVATALATISRMQSNIPAPLRTGNTYGWEFKGWATAPNTNAVTYTDGQSVAFTSNQVLYAVWGRTITRRFYASATATSLTTSTSITQYYRNTSTTAAGVTSYTRPALYAHSDSTIGWSPIGWSYGTSTTPDITSNITSSGTAANPVNVSPELNAVYTRSAGVTYNGNGNTGGSTNATAFTQSFNAANGGANSVSVTLASNGFTKTGYTFSKWAAGSTGGTQYAAGATFTPTNRAWTSPSSYPMYAIWAAVQNTVSFDANGGSGGQSANVTATYDSAMPGISTTAPTRTGYTFMGWYDNATYTAGTQYYTAAGASARTWDKTANTTLYAGWKPNTYTVSFNANGGSGGQSADVTATYDSAMPSISTTAPTRDGYTFIGWYDNKTYTAGTQYYNATGASARAWNKTANTTLYAGWRPNSYTVSFNANGGSGGQSATVTATYDSAMPSISTTAPTRTGYTFMGWYDNATYTSGTQYYTAAGASARKWDKTADTTLYAGWRANVYQVVFRTGSTNMGSQDFTYGVSQKLTAVSTMSNIPVLSTNGWTFAGWSIDANSTVEYEDGQSVSNLTTTHGGTYVLYGVWTRPVTFKYYNGATATGVTTSTRTQSYYNTSATAAGKNAVSTYPIVTQTGDNKWAPYGWALNSNTTTDSASTATTTAANVSPGIDTSNPIYTALYNRTYTITYDGNNATSGSTANTTGTQYFNSGSSSANYLQLTLAQNGFTKIGYGFSKWADLLAATPLEYAAGATYTVLNQNRTWASTPLTTMFAVWGAQQYEITLDQNGATTNATTTKLYTKYNTGVYSDSGRTTAMTTSSKVSLPQRQFTVTFNANGGFVSTSSATATSEFNGYWSATSGGTQYINASGTMLDAGLTAGKGYAANKTWYARWVPGSVALPTPTRTGYTFAGWATSCDATSVLSSPYTPTADVTLCATWSANMTGGIVLDSQYYASSSASTGTAATVSAVPTPIYIKYDTGVYASTSVNATAITKLTTLPTYTGYTFQGFYTGKAGTGAQVIDASGNFLTVTLYPTAGTTATWYAHYTANCNQVLLNANGGTAGSVATLYKKSGDGTWYTNAACTIGYAGLEAVKPTRSDYTFRGFYLKAPTDISSSESSGTARYITHTGETTNTGNNWKITGAAVLFAGWARNCEPGDKATCSLTVGQTTTYTTGCDTGYHIESGANTYAPVCQANTYYVQYDSNVDAAMGTPSWTGFKKLTYTYDTESYLEEAAVLWSGSIDYTYDGKMYSFVGWSRTPGATTPDSDLESPSDTGIKKAWNLTTTNGATVYLYAVWSSCLTCLVETGATCDLVDAITCTYETSCLPGYKEASGAGTYNPKCDPIEYQIKYNANCDGATGTMANTVLDYDDKVNLTTNGFTCGIKQFLGWADVNGCSVTLDGDRTCDVVYTQGQEVEKLTTADGSVVQLFAVWGDCMECMDSTPGASCWQSAPQGVCTYTTSCLPGYNTLINGGTTYPSCSANRYTVEYNMNCPSGATCSSAPSNTTCKYDETCIFSDIQSTSLYAGGYKLTGWASTTTGTGEAAGINLTTTNNGTVTRYAIWSKCAAGTYHPAGTGTAANVCTNAADGKFVAAAGATADVACAQGSYSEKSSASTQCVACQDGKTTSGSGQTSCNATCSNTAGVSDWETASWTTSNTITNLCTVAATAGCSENYYKSSNSCLTCSSGTNSKYTLSAAGTTSVNSCYLKTTAGKYVATKGAGETACISPYYCKGGTTVYYGTGTTTGGNSACTGLGSIYTKSDASASAETQCYATTSPGKYVTAKATAEAACPAGDWCEGSVKVYYGSAGGNTDCPSGYANGTTGYSQQSQCLMNVEGGKYVATPNESSASGTCAKGYANPAHTVNYGSTSSCTPCTGATYAASTGQTSCTACPTATNNASKATSYSYWNAGGTADHTTVTGCYVHYSNDTVDNGSASLYYCYADTDAATTGEYGVDGTSKGCWVYWDKLKCDGGYYNKNYSTSSNYDFTNKTIAKLKANACIAVEAGNWSANDALTRTACTSPLTTIGYGTGANEAADCGRKLHMGDNVVYLRSAKRTTPSLRVKVGGTTFYGALSTSLSSAMKVKNGSTEYSVVNDYQ